ncbi:NAD(P)/FAD-dependent oxidoreductase [Acuticoccus kandeliae]|uniref:NAD(P)/FAD-dependent oxidoreductase n=1 Tax=Acuticoccus kandeliae TaxID=2073160 RepID=UPI000D3E2ABE|nr:NAD(P)/FAD-dependent oxidoreductase [Acuticoccus kandeliae]
MDFDIVIVGGSFAGQAAALQLGRARRRVLLVDAGAPRNRFARTSHGFLGQDGEAPAAIMARAAAQLARYRTVEQRRDEAVDAAVAGAGFTVTLAEGGAVSARRLILATGVRDVLPDLPGLAERWGVSVLNCPYCHGYELDEAPLGVLATGPLGAKQAMVVPDWGPTTLFTQGIDPAPDEAAALEARGVAIEQAAVAAHFGPSPALAGVRLVDGREIALAGLFIAPPTVPASDLAARLGCAFKDGPTGPIVATDAMQATSVPGVFAAGDAASAMPNATLATAAGVMAGVAAHHSMIFGEGDAT